jgi:hypothetical protein
MYHSDIGLSLIITVHVGPVRRAFVLGLSLSLSRRVKYAVLNLRQQSDALANYSHSDFHRIETRTRVVDGWETGPTPPHTYIQHSNRRSKEEEEKKKNGTVSVSILAGGPLAPKFE